MYWYFCRRCFPYLGIYKDATSRSLLMQVADRPGTLTHVTAAIATANVNVQSLAVGGSETEGRSRITMVIPRDEEGLPRLISLVGSLHHIHTTLVSIEPLNCDVFLSYFWPVRCIGSRAEVVRSSLSVEHTVCFSDPGLSTGATVPYFAEDDCIDIVSMD